MPRKNRKVRKTLAVIDCETDPFKYGRVPKPFVWGLYAPSCGFMKFDTVAELVEFLRDKKWIVYAHNGGKFDFHFMLDFIPSKQELLCIHGRLVRFKIGACEFRDSYSILPIALKQFEKTKIDYALFEPEKRDENMDEIVAYLKDDCTALYKLVRRFVETYGNKVTLASAALNQVSNIEEVEIPSSGPGFYREISPWYYGGRVEVFKPGVQSGPIHVLDINSAYPFAMTFDHPWSCGSGAVLIQTTKPKKDPLFFYRLVCVSRGAFPWRDPADRDKRLSFPNDGIKREYFVTGWEYVTARKLGLLSDVEHIEHVEFLEKRSFKAYVEYFYQMKKAAAKKSPEYIFAKLFMNSAYGKFAANPEKYDVNMVVDGQHVASAINAGMKSKGDFGGNKERTLMAEPLEEDRQFFYNVATAASITGFVRAYLLKAIHSVDEIVYCDTDSVIFRGEHSLSLSGELGDWDHEGTFDEGCFAGKKMYGLYNRKERKYKKATKGVPGGLTYGLIKSLCRGKKIVCKSKVPIFSLSKSPAFVDKTIAATCELC